MISNLWSWQRAGKTGMKIVFDFGGERGDGRGLCRVLRYRLNDMIPFPRVGWLMFWRTLKPWVKEVGERARSIKVYCEHLRCWDMSTPRVSMVFDVSKEFVRLFLWYSFCVGQPDSQTLHTIAHSPGRNKFSMIQSNHRRWFMRNVSPRYGGIFEFLLVKNCIVREIYSSSFFKMLHADGSSHHYRPGQSRIISKILFAGLQCDTTTWTTTAMHSGE